VSVRLEVADAAATRALGARVAGLLAAGDLVLLTGPLGAGKTTLAQGVGTGLGVEGPVLSPTFVIARVHRGGRLPLVHVDAYRLGSVAEVDDLDLDATLEESVTLVEWGTGLVEGLADDRLEVTIARPAGGTSATGGGTGTGGAGDGEPRTVTVEGFGARWTGVDLGRLRA
jgi:tRNA threonylcarbamoyladenosine biosynthesis protein TsaE